MTAAERNPCIASYDEIEYRPMESITPSDWALARSQLLVQEKQATALLASLAAERRNLPMIKIPDSRRLRFSALDGSPRSLLDLFDGRNQLILYHQMPFDSNGQGCGGCAFFSDHIPHRASLEHLHSRNTTFAATAPATVEQISAFATRMKWSFPFYSINLEMAKHESQEESTTQLWLPESGAFKLACFWRNSDYDVFLTWTTTSRGVEPVLSTYALLDMTKLGRQEEQDGTRFHLHDQYHVI
ncbi:uncharacterized protein AB675_10720 [Cyphellophora attinorum]|uniref:DUF899 domain-containing protein n=1 Tax=Cyphellophora attinorum TaxID=1664694 RepID=A0A0N1HBJ3_9EURO|nr:uncharacterized protein AB675_10720 [Phialophora attinorum]KPI40762.1 hypothetical protein AB675_10720 [Phialophora attinorum]